MKIKQNTYHICGYRREIQYEDKRCHVKIPISNGEHTQCGERYDIDFSQ